jgi:hypothetical protein
MILFALLLAISNVFSRPLKENIEFKSLDSSMFDVNDIAQFAQDQNSPILDVDQVRFQEVDFISPPLYFQDEDSKYYEEQDGYWELDGFQIVSVPYYEMPDGTIMSVSDYESMMDPKEFDSGYDTDIQSLASYQDEYSTGYRLPTAQPGKFWKKLWNGIKKVAKVALPIMKFIPGPVGMIARGIDTGIKVYKGVKAVVNGAKTGGWKGALKAAGGAAISLAPGKIGTVARGLAQFKRF